MKYVESTVTIDTAKIKQLSEAAKTSLAMTADNLKSEVVIDQVIPFDSGELQNRNTNADTAETDQGKAYLTFSTAYARRLYYHPEYNFQTTQNPNAKGKWLEDYITGSKQNFAKETYMQLYRQQSGLTDAIAVNIESKGKDK